MVGQANAFIEQARDAELPVGYLLRDRDGMYIREFDQVFKDIGCQVEPTAPQAPNQNAYIERWIRSIKYEVLNSFLVFGKQHMNCIVSSYVDFYNSVRPHQSLDNRPLRGRWPEVDDPLQDGETIVCHEALGGMLKHYERRAA